MKRTKSEYEILANPIVCEGCYHYRARKGLCVETNGWVPLPRTWKVTLDGVSCSARKEAEAMYSQSEDKE